MELLEDIIGLVNLTNGTFKIAINPKYIGKYFNSLHGNHFLPCDARTKYRIEIKLDYHAIIFNLFCMIKT